MNRYKKARTVCKSLKNGAGVYQSCHSAGISPTTLWNWRKEKPSFDRFINKLFEGRTQMVIDALYKKALEGNPTAQIFWLKNKAGWKDDPVVDLSRHQNISITYKVTDGNKSTSQSDGSFPRQDKVQSLKCGEEMGKDDTCGK
jgi:hypothetical protein